MTARNNHKPTRAAGQRGSWVSAAAPEADAGCVSHDFADSLRTRISQTTIPVASAM
jgi:hypothetical protein